MASSTVASDVLETLDVHRHLASQVTLHHVALHLVTERGEFLLGQVLHALVVDARLVENRRGGGGPDAEDVGESDLRSLLVGYFDAGDTRAPDLQVTAAQSELARVHRRDRCPHACVVCAQSAEPCEVGHGACVRAVVVVVLGRQPSAGGEGEGEGRGCGVVWL